ncbi:alkaline phosphatase 4-like [Neocloeon triangulifer]|uniref:alkaline phosphatase 4-like n=1 Tax=Neocloeon triangulifer TaxID=2078957 RepID=UPI00286F502E|nr:alkaline phosphatase 4-like [Neocloeon triangulifer]
MRAISLIVLCAVVFHSAVVSEKLQVVRVEDKNFWYEEGKARIRNQKEKKRIINRAKNVIVFIGDGMGLTTVTASRIYQGQLNGETGEENYNSYDLFPDVGLVKTYNTDRQVPDSAGTATALFCGVKTKYSTIGVDDTVTTSECDPEIYEGAKVDSILKWAQDAGKLTGLVTTTRITHATPSAAYAHVMDRDWECDGEIPEQYRGCLKDIAVQLVEDSPGKDLNVIFGGGRQQLGFGNGDSSCERTDDRNLTTEWEQLRVEEGVSHRFVTTRGEMEELQDEKKVLGLFSYGHMPYDLERETGPEGPPSLVNMTVKAIRLLQKAENGFVLIVEGGRIDHAHHDNYARLALTEAVRFNEAVAAAVQLTDSDNTLIVVTADHSHSLTMNGYPDRGNSILDFAYDESDEGLIYETLTYANGPGYNTHRKEGPIEAEESLWKDVTQMNRNEPRYRHFAPIYKDLETHGGEDVAIYASGPFSHLFNGVFEQSYIAHVISCAGNFGPSADLCNSSISVKSASFLVMFMSFLVKTLI